MCMLALKASANCIKKCDSVLRVAFFHIENSTVQCKYKIHRGTSIKDVRSPLFFFSFTLKSHFTVPFKSSRLL